MDVNVMPFGVARPSQLMGVPWVCLNEMALSVEIGTSLTAIRTMRQA